ncbi:hypothetical protein E1301_Tti021960 [Triplophysa tibetana]|uniref:Uncharacterized protein n=1 Tax=Triplophysa tibetana TaxID=1572043 RepID=A0A5A9PEU8_9TELE|nr:hypothetical protein E1301_Tti021960 [Triplophysa tibetana]
MAKSIARPVPRDLSRGPHQHLVRPLILSRPLGAGRGPRAGAPAALAPSRGSGRRDPTRTVAGAIRGMGPARVQSRRRAPSAARLPRGRGHPPPRRAPRERRPATPVGAAERARAGRRRTRGPRSAGIDGSARGGRSSSRGRSPGPASHLGPTGSVLRANPCPEVTDLTCRLPLPALFQHARGCSPWRPAADMGTARRETYTFSTGFSRADESSPDAAGTAALSRARAPISGRIHSRAPCPLQRRENSPRRPRQLLRLRLRYRTGRLSAPVSALRVRGSEPDSLSIDRGQ